MSKLRVPPGQKIHTNRDGTELLIPASVDIGVASVSTPQGMVSTRYIHPTALIGENAKIQSNAEVFAHARVGEGAVLDGHVRVAPYAVVPSYWIIPEFCVVNRSLSQDNNAPPILVNLR